jgi:hypothetical protein
MVTYCTETTPTKWLADQGFRFGGRGEGAGGDTLDSLAPGEIFCKWTSKICIFQAMFRQYLFILSLHILKKKFQLIFLSQVSAFMKLTAFLE